MSKVDEEGQVQMTGLVREAIGEPESVASQKLTDEGHSNLFIQPSIYRTSTMCKAPLWVLKIYLQKKNNNNPCPHRVIFRERQTRNRKVVKYAVKKL